MTFLRSIIGSSFLLTSVVVYAPTLAEQPCDCRPGEFRYERDTTRRNWHDLTFKGIKCDCSSLELDHFPTSFSKLDQIVYLDLSGNNLTNSSLWDLSRFTSLHILDITDNPIDVLEPGTFSKGLLKMAELRLSAKLLTTAVKTLSNDTGMPNLVRMVIGGSEGDDDESVKSGEILNEATLPALTLFKDQLKELKITGLKFGGFSEKFVDGFKKLESIVLNNIHITKPLEFQTFINLPALDHFKISRSDIPQGNPYGVWSTFIKAAPNIRIVNMSRNNLASMEFLLEENNGNIPSDLSQIDLSHNSLSNIHLKNIYISSLSLSSNPQLTYMGDYKNTYIQKLDISNCSIKEFPKEAKFYRFDNNQAGLPPAKYANLTQLINLSQNPIEKVFPPNVFANFRQLKHLDLTGNTKIPCDCSLTRSLRTIPKVSVAGTCLNEGSNTRVSIENIMKTKIQLMTTTTCDVCPAKPCLDDQTCNYICIRWSESTCEQRQTNCTCDKYYAGIICGAIVTTPSTTTSTTPSTTTSTTTPTTKKPLTKTTIIYKLNTTKPLQTTSVIKSNVTIKQTTPSESTTTTTTPPASTTTTTATQPTTVTTTLIDMFVFLKSIGEVESLKSELKSNSDTQKIIIIVVAILGVIVIILVLGMCGLYRKYKKVEMLKNTMSANTGDVPISSTATSAVTLLNPGVNSDPLPTNTDEVAIEMAEIDEKDSSPSVSAVTNVGTKEPTEKEDVDVVSKEIRPLKTDLPGGSVPSSAVEKDPSADSGAVPLEKEPIEDSSHNILVVSTVSSPVRNDSPEVTAEMTSKEKDSSNVANADDDQEKGPSKTDLSDVNVETNPMEN